jgi:hypothetical protein
VWNKLEVVQIKVPRILRIKPAVFVTQPDESTVGSLAAFLCRGSAKL